MQAHLFDSPKDNTVITAHNLIKKMRGKKEHSIQALKLFHGNKSKIILPVKSIEDLRDTSG